MIEDTPRPKLPRQARLHPKPFRVVFEDAHLIVADKSPGFLTVPIPGSKSKNLKDMLDEYLDSKKQRAITVHRIDRFTSGLVVFAKNEKARDNLVAQFKAREPERVYFAIVRGHPPEEGSLRHNLMLGKAGFRQFAVRSGGTQAVTHYRVLERVGGLSCLEVRLETGLKNQIRVQFMEAGFPLVGDRHYEPKESLEKLLDRQALHSWKLSFRHPHSGRQISFEAPLAPDMERMLAKFRRDVVTIAKRTQDIADGKTLPEPKPRAKETEKPKVAAPKPRLVKKKKPRKADKGKPKGPLGKGLGKKEVE